MTTSKQVRCFFLTALLLAGCHASTSDAPQTLVEACSGKVLCAVDGAGAGHEVMAELAKDGSSCVISRSFSLDDDRSLRVTDAGHETVGTWTASTESFTLTFDAGAHLWSCLPHTPQCTGRTYCSTHDPEDCSRYAGCGTRNEWTYQVGWYVESHVVCDGSPPVCGTYRTEDDCKAQDCDWK